jgi:hypothetical protein
MLQKLIVSLIFDLAAAASPVDYSLSRMEPRQALQGEPVHP